jgi:hypothetical protein
LLHLSGDTAISWPGSNTQPVPIRGLSLLATARRLLLRSTTAVADAVEVHHEFGLRRLARSGSSLPLLVRTAAPFDLAFQCDAVDGEALFTWRGPRAEDDETSSRRCP